MTRSRPTGASFKVAIAGLGVVGAKTAEILTRRRDEIAQKIGRPIEISAVSAQTREKDRGFDMTSLPWFDDPVVMAREAAADLVCELIGGADGVAKAVVEATLARGLHVATANKALIAEHGTALAQRAEDMDVGLAYEAAVAGVVPIVKTLREGLAGNHISGVYGILNGTCNYILSTMRDTGRDFNTVLAEAQRLGYAETDPHLDIDGIDAAHKLAILSSLAFGTQIDFSSVHIEGIRHVSALDIGFAEELGYRIKLLGIARLTRTGIEQRVHPCMIKADTLIAAVDKACNAVVVAGDDIGAVTLQGSGAGAGPTAAAVVADILDLAGRRRPFPLGRPTSRLKPMTPYPMAHRYGPYYLRLMVVDRSGVFADIASALRDARISIEAVIQRGRAPNETAPVVITLHDAVEANLSEALRRIALIEGVVEPPCVIRIEPL